jgi:hypothetical protein
MPLTVPLLLQNVSLPTAGLQTLVATGFANRRSGALLHSSFYILLLREAKTAGSQISTQPDQQATKKRSPQSHAVHATPRLRVVRDSISAVHQISARRTEIMNRRAAERQLIAQKLGRSN